MMPPQAMLPLFEDIFTSALESLYEFLANETPLMDPQERYEQLEDLFLQCDMAWSVYVYTYSLDPPSYDSPFVWYHLPPIERIFVQTLHNELKGLHSVADLD